jgi:exodeoxyribonuclease VII small subunit
MAEKPKSTENNAVDAEKMPDFESNLKQLEEIVAQLEDGDLSLEESLEAYEAGIALSKECQKALDSAQQRVEQLIEKDGKQSREPFTDSPGE